MLRLLTILLLLACIVGIGYVVVGHIQSYTQNASLALYGLNRTALEATIREHYQSQIFTSEPMHQDGVVHINPTHISNDGLIDVIAHIESDDVCGTGGCITTIFIQNETGGFTPLSFEYAVKDIEVQNTLTFNMRDLKLNNNDATIMKWTGSEYQFESY